MLLSEPNLRHAVLQAELTDPVDDLCRDAQGEVVRQIATLGQITITKGRHERDVAVIRMSGLAHML